jgi:Integrase zinc binding domain/Integrase core domain
LSGREHALENSENGEIHAVTKLNPQWIEELKESYKGDQWAEKMLAKYQQGESLPKGMMVYCDIIRKHQRIYVGSSNDWRDKIVQVLHNSSIGGHSGILGTYQRIKKIFYWPKLKEEVINQVQQCEVCQLNKREHVPTRGQLEPLPIPEGVWQCIIMDFICGLPRNEGRDVIMVIIDKLTKYCHLIFFTHPFSAATLAEKFLEIVHKLHGLPVKIITDRDPIFTSNFWKELMQKLGVKLNFSTVYHPQIDGQTEKLNQCIETYLRCMVFNCPKKWHSWLPLAKWWYNTNFHIDIQTTPFKALCGYASPHPYCY